MNVYNILSSLMRSDCHLHPQWKYIPTVAQIQYVYLCIRVMNANITMYDRVHVNRCLGGEILRCSVYCHPWHDHVDVPFKVETRCIVMCFLLTLCLCRQGVCAHCDTEPTRRLRIIVQKHTSQCIRAVVWDYGTVLDQGIKEMVRSNRQKHA